MSSGLTPIDASASSGTHRAALLPKGWSFVDALGVAVAKCHTAPGSSEDSNAWVQLRDNGQLFAVYTIRDWRDVVYSWTGKFQMNY